MKPSVGPARLYVDYPVDVLKHETLEAVVVQH